jgi:Tfp pilus tip-associated adhesin PilY1
MKVSLQYKIFKAQIMIQQTLYALCIALTFGVSDCWSQAEVPVLADAPGNPQVMMLIDDSGSMNAVVEHPDFNPTSTVATSSTNDIPSIIFRLENGGATPTTSHTLRPVLIEINQSFNSSSTGTLFGSNSLGNYASIPAIANAGCINTSGALTNCPSPGPTTPQKGTNAFWLYGNTAITGNSIFQTSNLATFGGAPVIDSSNHRYLYTSYKKEDYNRTVEDWGDVWAKLDAAGNPQVLKTRAFTSIGGTVKFNGKQVFLSAGWYRIEYLRWIFYGATATQLANLPGKTRIQTVKDVVATLINNNPSVRWGLATLNGTSLSAGTFSGNLLTQWNQPLGNISQTLPIVRRDIALSNAALLSSLSTIGAGGGTPLAHRYIEVLRYFNGDTDNDSRISRTYPSPITGSTAACDGYFVIMLTDGLPTSDAANSVGGQWITDLDGNGLEAPDTSNNGCSTSAKCSKWLADAAKLAYDRDFNTSLIGKQNVRSYAVGFGLNYALLNTFAGNGGTGTAYLASSTQEISDTLTNIVTLIITSPIAGAGAALAETFGEDGIVYRPRFRADTWTGNIDVFQYDTQTDALTFKFDMAALLAQRNLINKPRTIIAGLDAGGSGKTNQTIAFSVGQATTLRPYLFRRFSTGIESATNLEPPLADYDSVTAAETLIRYVHGEAINDLRVRDRSLTGTVDRLGDIVYSRPVEVGAKNANYSLFPGYAEFTRSIQATQPRILLVGANDGMLHAFNSTTGEELWAYIPSSQLPFLERMTRMTYNAEFRRSYVDGPIAVEDVYVRGAWRTFAMFGLRRGGSTYTVLDITNRAAPSLVWEVSDPSLYGESWVKPVVVPLGSGINAQNYSFFMVVGTGEGKSSTGTSLVSYNLSSITPPTPTTTTLSATDPIGTRTSAITAVQADQDFSVERLYVGTEEGDLFRVTIPSAAGAWSVSKLFDGNNTQPIVAQPLTIMADNPQYRFGGTGVQGEPFALGVYVGTGRYDTTADIAGIGNVSQNIYGIFDPVRPLNDTFTNMLGVVTIADLQNQSPATYQTVRGSDGIYRLPNTRAGFYIPMTTSINLVNNFINPVGLVQYEAVNLRGAIFFSSFMPDRSTCGVGGHAFLEGVNFRTGGGLVVDYSADSKKPFYNGGIMDTDGDLDLDAMDLTHAINSRTLIPAMDVKVQSIDMTKTKPYSFDGKLTQDDVRLHASNGGILPAVSSLGNVGAPNPPVISQTFQKIIIQSAYPSGTSLGNAAGGEGGTGSGGSDTGSGTGGTVPPPDMVPISIYNLPIDILSFHEVTGE